MHNVNCRKASVRYRFKLVSTRSLVLGQAKVSPNNHSCVWQFFVFYRCFCMQHTLHSKSAALYLALAVEMSPT